IAALLPRPAALRAAKTTPARKPAARTPAKKAPAPKGRPLRAPVQRSVARDTSGTSSPEETVEDSKYNVGVPAMNLTSRTPKDLPTGYGKDRIVVMVRDPYWLHCYWELTRHAVQRAEAALGQDWNGAKPILRLLDVTSQDITSSAESTIRDIDIHGGCNNWYID